MTGPEVPASDHVEVYSAGPATAKLVAPDDPRDVAHVRVLIGQTIVVRLPVHVAAQLRTELANALPTGRRRP